MASHQASFLQLSSVCASSLQWLLCSVASYATFTAQRPAWREHHQAKGVQSVPALELCWGSCQLAYVFTIVSSIGGISVVVVYIVRLHHVVVVCPPCVTCPAERKCTVSAKACLFGVVSLCVSVCVFWASSGQVVFHDVVRAGKSCLQSRSGTSGIALYSGRCS